MVSECRPDELEAHALGELGEADAARVSAHVEACEACAGELEQLRRERRLFAARAGVHPAPPPLSAVLARAFEEDEHEAEAAPARPSEAAPPRHFEPAPARPFPAPRGRRGAGAPRAARRGSAGTSRAVVSTGARVLFAAAMLALPLALCVPRGGEAPVAEEPRATAAPEVAPVRASATAAEDPQAAPEVQGACETCESCEESCAPQGAEGVCGEEHPRGDTSPQEMGAECVATASSCVTSGEHRP